MPQAPRLVGKEVVLRGHELGDFDVFWAFYQSSDRVAYVGAPKTRTHLWYGMGSEIAAWPLTGMGGWAIETKGQLAGQVAVTQPPHFPEVEIGWTLFDGFEGHGIAAQAAQLALTWVWSQTDQTTLVSYIHPDNTRSIALATRLGAEHDPDAKLPLGEGSAETLVYRHRRPS